MFVYTATVLSGQWNSREHCDRGSNSTFILLGKPAEGRALNSYSLTQGKKRKGLSIDNVKDLRQSFNKKARHAVDDAFHTPST